MGVVYSAHDERLGRPVAVKMLSSVARDEGARKRFWREARAAASVSHPNICQIYEIGEDKGELFIAMELLEGEPLADLVRPGAVERVANGVDRRGHAVGAVRAPRPRHHPPRSQAVERLRHAARRQAARLRPGPSRVRGRGSDGHRDYAGRDADRHAALHGAGAGQRRGRRRARRPVRRRRHPVRDAGRTRRRSAGRSIIDVMRATTERSAAGARRIAGRRRDRSRDPAGAGQAGGRPVRVGGRDGGGAAGRCRARHRVDDRARTDDDAAGGAAFPDSASRRRDRLPGVQPGRRDHDLPLGYRTRWSSARAPSPGASWSRRPI